MPYVSWGTRKALGRRYSIDPAIELERQRLEQEYALQPGREARGIQASQFGQELGFRKSEAELSRSAAEKSGMIQTGMGAITNAAIIRALAMGKGQPFFGNWGAAAPVTAPTAGMETAGTGLMYTGGATMVPETMGPVTVSPAFTDLPAAGMAAPGTTTAGATPVASSAGMMSYLGPAAAGYTAPKIVDVLHKDSMENLGHNITFGLVRGEREGKAIGSIATGAAAGAAVGSIVPGVGTAVGGVVGGIAGWISSWF